MKQESLMFDVVLARGIPNLTPNNEITQFQFRKKSHLPYGKFKERSDSLCTLLNIGDSKAIELRYRNRCFKMVYFS